MRTTPLVMTCSLALAFIAAPAAAQNLDDAIAQVRKQRAAKQQNKQMSRKVKMLQALYFTDVTVRFEETPARDALDYLDTLMGVNMVVRYAEDATGLGIDPETPISLEAEAMSALDVLELVLEQCAAIEECTWQLRGSYVEVGTKERLSMAGAQEVRVYPIGELLFEAPYFDDAIDTRLDTTVWNYGGYYGGGGGGFSVGGSSYGGGMGGSFGGSTPTSGPTREDKAESIIQLITESVEPMAWVTNGGDWASIEYHDSALIVRAPDYIHRQINGYPRVPKPKRKARTPTESGTTQPSTN